jgi:hypothetical protein
MEKSKTPMYLNIIAICVSRVGWVSFVFPLYPRFEVLFYCYPISWALCSVSLLAAYLVFELVMVVLRVFEAHEWREVPASAFPVALAKLLGRYEK